MDRGYFICVNINLDIVLFYIYNKNSLIALILKQRPLVLWFHINASKLFSLLIKWPYYIL